jgi:hypothetical protein
MATDRYIKKLFHVCITVPDIDEALDFYQGVLGLESVGSLRNEKTDGAALGFPGQEIEIHADHLSGKITDNATVIDLIQFVKPATIVDEGPTGRQTTWESLESPSKWTIPMRFTKSCARAAISNSWVSLPP